MSDTSDLDAPPPDAILQKALRSAVQLVYTSGNLEELTVKRIRKLAENELKLEEDFFKNHIEWKDRSKEIISSEVDAHEGGQEAPSPPKSAKATLPTRKVPKDNGKLRGVKRASIETADPKKRQKKDALSKRASTSDQDVPNSKPTKRQKPKSRSRLSSRSPSPEDEANSDGVSDVQEGDAPIGKAQSENSESELSDPPGEAPKSRTNHMQGSDKTRKHVSASKGIEVSRKADDSKIEDPVKSESEMSELIDEPRKPKGRKSGSTEPKIKKSKSSKGAKPPAEPADPVAEEIKRLQGWLVKCGIRKMWFKELAPYSTSKAKIKHLKEMLADAGMTGRYSEAKAEQIKEERELKADLEAVQEGDKMWGQEKAEDDPATGRPKRRLAKGFEGLDFLNDDDGEETD